MIWNEEFVWLHMPKTAGTTMSKFFMNIDDPSLNIDDDSSDIKHDSVLDRELRTPTWRVGTRKICMNFRKLEDWLVSDWNHKREKMRLHDLPFEPVKSGLFYSLKLGGVWVSADYWLRYFDINESIDFIRVESLHSDFVRTFKGLVNFSGNTIDFGWSENQSKITSIPPFASQDLVRIFANNPIWSSIQNRLY